MCQCPVLNIRDQNLACLLEVVRRFRRRRCTDVVVGADISCMRCILRGRHLPVAGVRNSYNGRSLVKAPVLACAPSVVSMTHEAPRGGPLLDFGTEPASQEVVPRHSVEVSLTGRNPTETSVPLASQRSESANIKTTRNWRISSLRIFLLTVGDLPLGGWGADCKLGLTIVRFNLLSKPETLAETVFHCFRVSKMFQLTLFGAIGTTFCQLAS